MAIKIVIDSASDIDLEEAQALGVTLVPMEIQFSDEKYSDGVTLSHREFFEKLVESAELPKKSVPTTKYCITKRGCLQV